MGNLHQAKGVPRKKAGELSQGLPAPIKRSQVPLDPTALARWLIGKRLIRTSGSETIIGRIVETEAYLADDPASHSFKGRTPRNRAMFTPRGHAYVYRIYGMWFCLNVSAGPVDHGAAVLIRAGEPLTGTNHIVKRRGEVAMREAMRGPGRLCAALDIDLDLDGLDLCSANGALWLAANEEPSRAVGVSVRIGITKAADKKLRFYERGNPNVSGPARLRA